LLLITFLITVTVTVASAAIIILLGGWTPPSGRALGLLAFTAVRLLIGKSASVTGWWRPTPPACRRTG